jgi:hypothetical protein
MSIYIAKWMNKKIKKLIIWNGGSTKLHEKQKVQRASAQETKKEKRKIGNGVLRPTGDGDDPVYFYDNKSQHLQL